MDWLAVKLAHTCALILVLGENAACSARMQQVLDVPSASREKTCTKETEGTSVAVGQRLTFDLLGTVCEKPS